MNAYTVVQALKEFLTESSTTTTNMWDDEELMRYCNYAQRRIYNERIARDRYWKIRTASITMDGTGTYTLPVDFKRIIAITESYGSFLYAPSSIALADIYRWRGVSALQQISIYQGYRWTIYDNTIMIEPSTTTGTLTVYYTRQPIDMQYGTVAALDATSITLATTPTAGVTNRINDYYNNAVVEIVSGTGVGQQRTITDYVGSTKVITVATWTTNPDTSSVYSINSDLEEDFEEAIVLRAAMIALLKEGQPANPQLGQMYSEALSQALMSVAEKQGFQKPRRRMDYD